MRKEMPYDRGGKMSQICTFLVEFLCHWADGELFLHVVPLKTIRWCLLSSVSFLVKDTRETPSIILHMCSNWPAGRILCTRSFPYESERSNIVYLAAFLFLNKLVWKPEPRIFILI